MNHRGSRSLFIVSSLLPWAEGYTLNLWLSKPWYFRSQYIGHCGLRYDLFGMKSTPFALPLAILAIFLVLLPARAQDASSVEAAFQRFWTAKSPMEAERVVDSII